GAADVDPAALLALVSMNAGAACPVVPLVPAGRPEVPRWMQPSTAIESAFLAALCGSAGVVSAPAAGCATRGGAYGSCGRLACAASDAHRRVARVVARNILLMREFLLE